MPRLSTVDLGVGASRLQLPPGPWNTVLDGLVARFPAIDRAQWLDRIDRGLVIDSSGAPVFADTPYRVGAEIRYWREVPGELRIVARESVLHVDEHLVVADKPHGLPVMPAGTAVAETLLARLKRRLGNSNLVPLHRIDRATAGLVMFSACAASRAAYHALFRERRVAKHYEAIAPPLPGVEFPYVRRTRIERGEPFFRMREVEGVANTETEITVLERSPLKWRYGLRPVTGRKHQLRVHMAALGASIFNDPLYPELRETGLANLQLLARSLDFEDPLRGGTRSFRSRIELDPAVQKPGDGR